jgi:hypothetical protein
MVAVVAQRYAAAVTIEDAASSIKRPNHPPTLIQGDRMVPAQVQIAAIHKRADTQPREHHEGYFRGCYQQQCTLEPRPEKKKRLFDVTSDRCRGSDVRA